MNCDRFLQDGIRLLKAQENVVENSLNVFGLFSFFREGSLKENV